jgi:DNA-binding transcriptional regulator LsrR (DeoR family)
MAKARLSMRKIKEVLRLKFNCDLSRHQIAESCQISRSTAADYLSPFRESGPELAAARSAKR